MADEVTTNISAVNAQLAAMEKAMRGKVLETAIRAGLLPIETRAKVIVHKDTTTLARSIHSEAESDGATARGRTGTDVEYALREEFLDGGGHAYMRPAYDAERETAVAEVAAVLKDQVRRSA